MELRTDGLVYQFSGREKRALDGVTLGFPAGQRVAIMGRNGSGKTTLILHLNGVIKPQQGRIYLQNGALNENTPVNRLRQAVGVVFQSPDDQLFSASVIQDIGFGPLNLGLGRAEAAQRVQEAAACCRVTHLLNCPVHGLSAGEKARVALAGVLAMQPGFIIVDEAVSSLDPWMRAEILDIFDELVAQGKTILLITHEVQLARAWAERLIVMENGRVAFDGDPETGIIEHKLDVERKGRK